MSEEEGEEKEEEQQSEIEEEEEEIQHESSLSEDELSISPLRGARDREVLAREKGLQILTRHSELSNASPSIIKHDVARRGAHTRCCSLGMYRGIFDSRRKH